MRLVIDKDFNERTLLQESYDKKMPTYVVKAVNKLDKFVYAKGLKSVNEAVDAAYDLAYDSTFDDCSAEIVEVVEGKENVIWTYESGLITEAASTSATGKSNGSGKGKNKGAGEGGFWSKLGANAKKALDGLKKGISVVGEITKQFSKDMLKKWREAGYFNKQGYITGLGYKVMNGEVKNTIPVDTGDDKTQDIAKVWESAKSNVVQGLKKQGMTVNGEIDAIVKNDKDAILLSANVTTKDGDDQTLTLDQDGNIVDGDGSSVDAAQGDEGNGIGSGNNPSGGSTALSGATPEQINKVVDKNPTAAVKTIGQQVAQNTKDIEELKKGNVMSESTTKWNFNGKQNTDKQGMERLAISTFFKTLNESNIKGIKFVDFNGNVKKYDLSNGSSAYAQFKKDFKESTSNANGKFAEYKFTIKNKATESKLNGFKFSDFGDIEKFTESKDIVLTASVVDFKAGGDDGTKTKTNPVTESKDEQKVETKEAVNESLVLEMDVVNPADQIKALVASMNKFTSGKPETSPLTKPTANVSTPVSTFGMPEQEVVAEAEGDEEGGDEADPFADDAGGGDEGGDAGGEADPFADDAGGGEEGGDAGAEGGDEADPFAGGDDAGGDAGGDDASAEDPNDPTGEPSPEPAINTDAQGNQKSQYNINVTKAFNVDDSFELNEEEQQEFFGKIDQLVKIPDMENYALYLYQITPDNVNLDDVHYITALYELSVKLGLLEDVYADSNLLEKYSSYKYSVVKNGEEGENGQDELTIQEGRKYAIMEGTDKPKVQKDNEEKNEKSKKVGSSKDDDERRGPKDMKLDKDENGADKPVIIDANEYGWENKDKKLSSSTEMDDFRGLGWVVTFKAMQFGSPRYMTLYIKKNGNEKAETQCKKYLEKLSYSEIDIVKIEEIDPYEYVYRNGAAGMKSVEEVHGAAVVNKDIPYLESTKEDAEQPSLAKEGAMSKFVPDDIKRDVKGVLTKLNSEIRNTKQFNFANECGVYKPQVDHVEFMNCYRTAKVDETVGDTTYKFILKKNDSMMSRMFYSNLQEKLFKYLGTFATKYNMECNCQACPTYITIDFVRSDLNNPMGYDLDTMVDKEEEALPEEPAI